MVDWTQINANYAALGQSITAAQTPPPAPTPDLITSYDGSFFGSKGFRVVAVSNAGVAYPEPRPTWAQDPTYVCDVQRSPIALPGDVCGNVDWGTSREYHRISTQLSIPWLWIDGYGPTTGGFYPVETIRADWINVDTNATQDVTPKWAAPQGQPYMPATVYTSGHYRIRIWGWIWSSMTAGRSNTFYWEGDFTYGQNLLNVAWKGDTQTTKPCIVIREGWWSNNAWVRATGNNPFDANNNPVVPTINYLGWNANAKGVGTMWVYSYSPNVAGLESIRTLGGA